MATELVLRGWENVYVLSGGESKAATKAGNDLLTCFAQSTITGLNAVAVEHPQLVEGSSPPTRAAAGPKGGGEEDPLRLCEANLAHLALLGKGGSARGSSRLGSSNGSYRGGGRTASVASAAGSVVVTRGPKRCGATGGGLTAPSVTTAGTRLSVAETVIARAQARRGMF